MYPISSTRTTVFFSSSLGTKCLETYNLLNLDSNNIVGQLHEDPGGFPGSGIVNSYKTRPPLLRMLKDNRYGLTPNNFVDDSSRSKNTQSEVVTGNKKR